MPELIERCSPARLGAVEAWPMRADPDTDLVEALRTGRGEAADDLVACFGPRAYRLALRITGDQRDAEEAVQDALWRVIDKIDTFRRESSLGSWVYRITANAAHEKLRRRHHARHEISWEAFLPTFDGLGRHAAAITDWSPRVEDPAVRGELRAELTRALDHLPPDYRTVLVMRDIDGMSNADVGTALGMSVPAVKSRLHRARLFLREWLSRFWATEGRAEDARRARPGRRRRPGRSRSAPSPHGGERCHGSLLPSPLSCGTRLALPETHVAASCESVTRSLQPQPDPKDFGGYT